MRFTRCAEVVPQGTFSCPSGNSPCVAPAESKPHVQQYGIRHCAKIKKWEHTVLPYGRKNPLPFPFSKRSPVSGLRQIRNKGNGIHKGGNLGVHPCAHRRGYGEPPSQRLAATPPPQDTAVKTCRKNWLSTLSTGLSTGYLGITLCIKWITFCIHPRRPPYISVFRLRIVISAVEKPPLHNPPHLVENL